MKIIATILTAIMLSACASRATINGFNFWAFNNTIYTVLIGPL